MERVPPVGKFFAELLFEYRFDNLCFHSLDYHSETNMISLGTNKGTILNYIIYVDVLQCFDEEEMKNEKIKVIYDKDINSD
jgi:hypothetical protein